MTSITSMLSRLVLAITLATGAAAAVAAPVNYHVTFDTSAYSGDGYIDLGFAGLDAAAAGSAVVSNFTGAVTGATSVIGAVSGDLTSTATFNAADSGDLAQLIHLGGVFGFDVAFDYASTGAGITFAMSLLDTNFSSLTSGNFFGQIFLSPDAGVTFAVYDPLATVAPAGAAAVPEPAEWLLTATGLLLMGARMRRRSREASVSIA